MATPGELPAWLAASSNSAAEEEAADSEARRNPRWDLWQQRQPVYAATLPPAGSRTLATVECDPADPHVAENALAGLHRDGESTSLHLCRVPPAAC